MTKQKMGYESPSTNVLVVRFEQGFLTGSLQWGQQGEAGADQMFNDYGSDF